MVICNKNFFINVVLIFFFSSTSYSETNFKKLEKKTVSYLDFFLLKYENKLSKRAYTLGSQMLATRVQYSNIGIEVNFDRKKNKIFTEIYAIMDKNRYSKKKYNQKISDCNQVRNLIFYKKYGYKFFTQKRDPTLSEVIMENIFIEVFFENINFNENEIKFLLDKMFIKIIIFHPIQKKELTCSGKVNDYKLS
jgi:hypothetical protein